MAYIRGENMEEYTTPDGTKLVMTNIHDYLEYQDRNGDIFTLTWEGINIQPY